MGWSIRKYEDVLSHKLIIIGMLVSFIILCIEVSSLSAVGVERYSFVLLTLPCAFFAFACISMIKTQNRAKRLASVSLTVYCIHPIIIGIMVSNACNDPMIQFVLVTIVSTLLALGYDTLRRKLTTI